MARGVPASQGSERPRSGRRRRLRLLCGAAAFAIALTLGAYAAHALPPRAPDPGAARFSTRGAPGAPRDIGVVAFPDAPSSELPRQFPFPRSVHARVVDRLRAA